MDELTIAEKIDAQEMIDQYQEYNGNRYKSLPPIPARVLLPDGATFEDGKLKVSIDNKSRDINSSSLTSLGKEILQEFNAGENAQEIADMGISSYGYALETKNQFEFLLNNPVLFNAYVVENGVYSKSSPYILCDVDDEYAIPLESDDVSESLVLDFQTVVGKDAKLINTENGEFTIFESSTGAAQDDESQSSENGESPTKSVPGNEDQSDETITRGEWKEIVGELYRGRKDDLAGKVIDEML